jgi:hypothetical protein
MLRLENQELMEFGTGSLFIVAQTFSLVRVQPESQSSYEMSTDMLSYVESQREIHTSVNIAPGMSKI